MPKNNYVLIHGQLVEVSDDVLMHWKYIKREKKNGRWVYTYDLGKTEKEAHAKAYADFKRAKDSWEEKSERFHRKGDAYLDSVRNGASKAKQDSAYKASKRAYAASDAAYDKLKASRAACEKAFAKYEKTPLYKLEEASSNVKKGLKAVGKFLSKLFKKK